MTTELLRTPSKNAWQRPSLTIPKVPSMSTLSVAHSWNTTSPLTPISINSLESMKVEISKVIINSERRYSENLMGKLNIGLI